MSRMFEEVKNEGIRFGEEKERLNSIRNIMKSLNLSAAHAMEVLKIPIELREKYSEKLGCK